MEPTVTRIRNDEENIISDRKTLTAYHVQHCSSTSAINFLKRFYLFLFREGERGRKREGNINVREKD